MKFGICGGMDIAPAAAAAGFEYLEMKVGELLRPLEADDAFEAQLAKLRTCPLPCPAVNFFFPANIKITGPAADMHVLEQYVSTCCRRAAIAGVKFIGFGSGPARSIPDGFPRDKGWEQLKAFCLMAGATAQASGVTIVIEPFNRKESNVLNTVPETADLIRQVNHPAIRLIVDCYHWGQEHESPQAILDAADLIAHAHLGTVPGRFMPGEEEYDFKPFLRALKQAGYDGRVTFEGNIKDPANLPKAVEVFNAAAAD